jgi:hypothetical protein
MFLAGCPAPSETSLYRSYQTSDLLAHHIHFPQRLLPQQSPEQHDGDCIGDYASCWGDHGRN